MKAISKRVISLVLALFMLSMSMCQIVLAEDNATEKLPEVKFVLSEPDGEGYTTASLMIYNATFAGAQFGFSFDNTVLQFVDKETKEPSDNFSKVATCYSFENELGVHKFTELGALSIVSNAEGKLRLGVYGMPSKITDERANVTVNEGGFKLYDFSMKFLKNEDPGFEVLDYGSNVFSKEAILAKGGENLTINFSFVLPESLGKEAEEIVFAPAEPEPSLEEKREVRLADSLILNIGNYAAVDDGFLKWIDESNKNVVPFIEADRTFIPLRFVGEAFGAKVLWNADNQEIKINLDEIEIVMNIGKTAYTVNGEEKKMDVAPFIKEDRTIVPVRFVSEALRKAVYWDAQKSLVIVTPEDKPWDPDGDAEKSILPAALMIISDLIRDIKLESAE